MRTFLRSFAVAAVLILGVGPAVAAPMAVEPALTIGAPQAPADMSLDLTDLLYLAPVVFGITIRKTAADIASKFSTRAGAASNDYKLGVETAGATWEAETRAAESAYEQGVQEAINRKAFIAGVSKAGSAKYQKNAAGVGPARYSSGVANAKDAYSSAMAPVLDVLRNLVLPPKGARRSPANQQRSNAVATALGNWKTNK